MVSYGDIHTTTKWRQLEERPQTVHQIMNANLTEFASTACVFKLQDNSYFPGFHKD